MKMNNKTNKSKMTKYHNKCLIEKYNGRKILLIMSTWIKENLKVRIY
jgi:hypothetical protein